MEFRESLHLSPSLTAFGRNDGTVTVPTLQGGYQNFFALSNISIRRRHKPSVSKCLAIQR
jgi:hypothetical protein